MLDLRQTDGYAEYMRLLGWEAGKIKGMYYFCKRLPILGSIIKIQRFDKLVPIPDLEILAKHKKAFVVFLEPLNNKLFDYYSGKGKFKLAKTTNLPSKTIRFDLSKKDEKILKDMHYKTRYNIGLAVRRAVKVRTSKNIHLFSEFWHRSARKRGLYFSMRNEIYSIYKAFGGNAIILFAYLKKELIAAVLLIKADKSLHYMYAASTKEGNRNFAPTLLVWEAIKLAKRIKLKKFDFEGIYDERYPLKTWKGFTRFKESFGGKVIVYPGTIRKYYFPF